MTKVQAKAKAKASAKPRGASTKKSVRLERGEGNERTFWEIARTGAVIRTKFGKYLSAGRTIEKEHEDAAHAERAFEKMIADKREEGYGEAVKRAAPGAASVKGVSVKNPEIEALI